MQFKFVLIKLSIFFTNFNPVLICVISLSSERGGKSSVHRPQRAGHPLGSRPPPERRLPREPWGHGHRRYSAAADVFVTVASPAAAAATGKPRRRRYARTWTPGPAFCQRYTTFDFNFFIIFYYLYVKHLHPVLKASFFRSTTLKKSFIIITFIF